MTATPDSPPPKRGKGPLLLGLGLALAGGGAGFWGAYAGLIPGLGGAPGAETAAAEVAPTAPTDRPSFLAIDPITINLGGGVPPRHLRFVAQLEVAPDYAAEVGSLMPRIVDVLNTYLRAVDLPELEEPAGLVRIRAQMLRRVQLVAGPGRVKDLLVMEFVFN